ncbi:MAG TPA: hypothetical protein VFW83_04355 [Bryobacteraceae bacterium]|nr:hypothetical protein [Bryobacteraceae bacterium]
MALSFRSIRTATVLMLSVIVPATTSWAAEEHIVSLGEIHGQIASAAQTRHMNLQKAEALFSMPPAQNALRHAKMDPAKVQTAVAALDDAELARLAARADKVQANLKAGALSNQDLTYIVIALATAVVVIVILKS